MCGWKEKTGARAPFRWEINEAQAAASALLEALENVSLFPPVVPYTLQNMLIYADTVTRNGRGGGTKSYLIPHPL